MQSTAQFQVRDDRELVVRDLSAVVIDPSCFSTSYDHCLCEGLFRSGCTVTLARSPDLYGEWKLRGCYSVWEDFYKRTHGYARTHARGRLWRLAKAAEHPFSMRNLALELESLKPSVIHFQWLPLPLLDRLYLPRLRRIAPLVLTLHNTTMYHGDGYKVQEMGFRSAFEHFSSVIVHTEYSKRRTVEQGWATAEKVHVIPYGALDYYRELAPEQNPPTKEATVMFFGILKPYKGVDLLIRAFAELPGDIRAKTRLLIVGTPVMDIAPLKQLADRLGISERITWRLRYVEEEEVPGLFSAASIVVLPYREIDQSGVLMTAIAFDKPIVATRIGGFEEVIRDGVHGHLVEPEDVTGLAVALRNILANPKLRHRMQRALRDLRTNDLCWDKIAQRTIAVYRSVCSN